MKSGIFHVPYMRPERSPREVFDYSGLSPISFFGGLDIARSHWDTYAKGAAAKGYAADRCRFRICRDIVVADTDKEAKRIAIEGGLGHCWRQYLVPVYKTFNILDGYIDGTDIDAADIDLDFIAEHVWICGSPETVIEKMAEDTGGFGQIVMNTHDYVEDPKPWIASMHRIAKEVVPKVRGTVQVS
ncbi:hypothetical protein ABZ863_18945 [Saccharomonospora sp. NPDC046836]|uniref:hypothetical protein n=1 Tax=Saccharomonospora sp. NPDC046836 TaxID=3156921 RepID=UPI0033E469A8